MLTFEIGIFLERNLYVCAFVMYPFLTIFGEDWVSPYTRFTENWIFAYTRTLLYLFLLCSNDICREQSSFSAYWIWNHGFLDLIPKIRISCTDTEIKWMHSFISWKPVLKFGEPICDFSGKFKQNEYIWFLRLLRWTIWTTSSES